MSDDAELLRRYAGNRDEDAFAELVRRHLGLVYHAALRQCGGDVHRAEDVAQAVFTDLARKAAKLARRPVLAGWLYTSTRYAAGQAVRTEARRQAREQEAHAMNEILSGTNSPAESTAEWERLRPVIDDALHALGERDREAVLLRFFEGRAFAEVGARQAVSEDAARMRVERALERMRAVLVRRGVTSTAAALGMALASQAGVAAPAGLASAVAGAALAGGAASGSVASMAAFMSMTKLQAGITGALVVATAIGLTVQHQNNSQLREEIESLHRQNPPVAQVKEENQRLAGAVADMAERRKAAGELAILRRAIENMKVSLLDLDAMEARNRRVRQALEELAAPLVGPVFAEKELDTPPKPRFQFQPVPPPQLSRRGTEVDFLFEITIDARGDVRNVVTLRSEPREFELGFVQTVRGWTYTPAQKGGQAVNSRIEVPIRFTMGKSDGPPQPPRRPEKRDWF